jgi:catechol 2,3-dioxygenase-like lactoylglutathione lyase family enzyme
MRSSSERWCIRRLTIVPAVVSAAISLALAQAPAAPAGVPAATITGLDHIPIAVNDLEKAADDYRALGFVLKPGRPHDNGIRNQHVKFPDGTELELITAPAARDPLTTTYRRHLAQGDGPAFLAFYAPSRGAAIAGLDAAQIRHRDGDLLGDLDYVFLGPRNESPTDRPEHFAHANGAESLVSVWLAGADLSAERKLLTATGAIITQEEVHVPGRRRAEVAHLTEGTVVLLPESQQILKGRRIVGATLRVADVSAARRAIGRRSDAAMSDIVAADRSLFLPPSITHGLWIELRQQ